MKATIFATIALVAVVGCVTANAIALHQKIGEAIEDVTRLDTEDDDALLEAIRIKEKFAEAERFISLTVNHEDLTNIEVGYSELVGYLSEGMTEEAGVTKSRLLDALTHLRRLSGVNIDSII